MFYTPESPIWTHYIKTYCIPLKLNEKIVHRWQDGRQFVHLKRSNCEELNISRSYILSKTENFIVAIYTGLCSDMPYITALAFQEDMLVYANNEESKSPSNQVVTWEENLFFTEIYLSALGSLVESGIFVYRQEVEFTLKYKDTFLKFTNIPLVNIFTVANMLAKSEIYP